MTSHMDHMDFFLTTKDDLLKDDFILNTDDWCIGEDKFLESIRCGDKMPVECLDQVVTAETLELEPEEAIYSIAETEDVLSPADSASSSCSTSSDQYEDQNQNVKVVQLVGILPPGVKAIQILQRDEDDETMQEDDSVDSSPATTCSPQEQTTMQELKLSEEEKRLLTKEGVALPTHYPLTKFEERELKRIRRKIRNKISAQDSRKRKKEYLDKLQQKVQEVEDEKTNLSKRVRTLETANSKLSAQVKRLQVALANANNKANSANANTVNNSVVPAATTLLVLILSLALVVLPTMENKKPNSSMETSVISAFKDTNPNGSIFGRSRTMMSVPNDNNYVDEWNEDDIDIAEPQIKIPRFSFHQTPGGKFGGSLSAVVDPPVEKLNIGKGKKLNGHKRLPSSFHTIDEVDI